MMKSPKKTSDEKTDQKPEGTGSETEQDAVALLKADHRRVEQLFEQYKSAGTPSGKSAFAKEICTELIVHTAVEEEIFYPACREKATEHAHLNEAQVEH